VESRVTTLRLAPAAPNPFRARTALRWALPQAGDVRVRVHDVAGRLVRTLQNGWMTAGEHSVAWDSKNDRGGLVRPGLYFVRLEHAGRSVGEKVVLLP
jgi:flagellar hook assembly protein FlgD